MDRKTTSESRIQKMITDQGSAKEKMTKVKWKITVLVRNMRNLRQNDKLVIQFRAAVNH